MNFVVDFMGEPNPHLETYVSSMMMPSA
jgi:hypothetical protein